MSYDMFLFDPDVAPKNHADFMEWYMAEAESDDDLALLVDPARTSAKLRMWFDDMRGTFPALNGPARPPDIEDRVEEAGDYNFRPHSIYVCFGWPQATEAYRMGEESARRLGVGLLDLASPVEDVYLPHGGGWGVAHNNKPPGLLARLFGRKR